MHKIAAFIILLSGAVNIVSAFWGVHGRLVRVEEVFPLEVLNASRTFTLLSGFFLVYLSRGLFQRKRRAWALSLLLLSGSFLAHLLRGPDSGEALIALFAIALLAVERHEFFVTTPKITQSERLRVFVLFFALLFVYSVLGHHLLRHQFSGQVTLGNIYRNFINTVFGLGPDALLPRTHRARWFEESSGWMGFMALMFALRSMLGPVLDRRDPTDQDRFRIRELQSEYGDNPGSYFALMSDKKYYFTADRRAVIAYREAQGIAVVAGDPVSSKDKVPEALREFLASSRARGVSPVFANASQSLLDAYSSSGLKSMMIGEEAVIPVSGFTLEGSEMKDIRNAVKRIQREKAVFNWYPFDQVPSEVAADLDGLHEEWLSGRKSPALGFTVDFYPLPPDPACFLLSVRGPDGKMWGAFSFLPFQQGKGMVLDLMLRSKIAPNGTVEAAIAEAVGFFRKRGAEKVSLGVAPLSDTLVRQSREEIADKTKRLIFENFNQFYGYRTLFQFKKKFRPDWEHKYLVYRSNLDLPKIAVALVQVHLRDSPLRSLWSYLR